MAVKIRLKRMGAKKTPFYRIVVSDSRSPRDGRFIEEIGYYNPLTDPADIKVNHERADYWISCGAQPSDTVRALIKKSAARAQGIEEPVKAKKAKPAEAKPVEAEAAAPAEAEAAAPDTAEEPVIHEEVIPGEEAAAAQADS